jgi:hypothetical protein
MLRQQQKHWCSESKQPSTQLQGQQQLQQQRQQQQQLMPLAS